jgi:Tfp pilus assembly protein PilF
MKKNLFSSNTSWFAGAGLLAVITAIAYFPVIQNSYIWDDDRYLTGNPYLKDIEGLKRFWFDLKAMPQYYPLVFTSFWIEHQLWGLNPIGYHVINVLIHCSSAIFLWRILNFLDVPGSWFAAAVFALHPVHVESVAWITERKNILSGFFYLSSLYFFLRFYSSSPSKFLIKGPLEKRFWALWGISLFFFICALWSKTVTCTLPAVILVIFWWKQNRVEKKLIPPLIPFFVLALGFAYLTAWLEKVNVGAMGPQWEFSFWDRFLIAGRALWFYIGKLIWPSPIIFTYPRWQIDDSVWWQYVYPLSFVFFLIVLWVLRKKIGRGPLAAVLFFAGSLFPALGFIDVYPMRFSFVADHFQYLSSIGIIVLLTSGLAPLAVKRDSRFHQLLIFGTLFFLGSLTFKQVPEYKNPVSLWENTKKKNPMAWMAHYNLGLEYANSGKLKLAIPSYKATISNKPDHFKAHFNLGNAYRLQGKYREAVKSYENALNVKPDHFMSLINMGNTLGVLNESELAIDALEKAIRLKPDHINAHYNLGILFLKKGDLERAKYTFEETLRLSPNDKEAKNALLSLKK